MPDYNRTSKQTTFPLEQFVRIHQGSKFSLHNGQLHKATTVQECKAEMPQKPSQRTPSGKGSNDVKGIFFSKTLLAQNSTGLQNWQVLNSSTFPGATMSSRDGMNAGVACQHGLLGKRHWTEWAAKGAFPSVSALVVSQVGALQKGLATLCAPKRALCSCIDGGMARPAISCGPALPRMSTP